MAFFDDQTICNTAGATGDWTTGGTAAPDSPTLNDSAATTPIYIEGTACMWFPIKKDADGHTYESSSVSLTGRIVVGWLNYPFADIAAIPLTTFNLRVSSAAGFTTNYGEWDALAQVDAPENTPVSGHTPIMGYPDGATESGTPNYGSLSTTGWYVVAGSTADGKQGGFDMIHIISYLGVHSETRNGTFFSGLFVHNYPATIPGTTNKPYGVLSEAGNFYLSNVNFQIGHGTSDTANSIITETGKTVFFNNLHLNHELGYVFVDPASTNEIQFTLTDCVHFWNDQVSTAEIFTDATNATHFKIDGCAFSSGGKFTLPADTANRWVRSTKFDNCQAGTISDGEFTDCIVSNGEAVTVTGDADLTGSSILTPVVAANASGLLWNGNFDPDGNLDGMTFSKGTNAHHAIEFGTASPLTMTLRNMDFSGFSATDSVNDSTFHVKRTTGTVTINAVGVTGNLSYRSDGAIVNIVVNPVTVAVNVTDTAAVDIQNARVLIVASAGPLPSQDSVTIVNSGTTATVTHTAHGMDDNDYVEIEGASHFENNGVFQITFINANSYSYTMSAAPGSNPTGSITSTFVALQGLTDVNGDLSVSRTYGANQPISGRVRKSSSAPFYKTSLLAGTVDSSTGFSASVQMILDQ